MLLTKHRTPNGSRWAVDGHFLPPSMNLTTLLEMTRGTMFEMLEKLSGNEFSFGREGSADRSTTGSVGGGSHLFTKPRGTKGGIQRRGYVSESL